MFFKSKLVLVVLLGWSQPILGDAGDNSEFVSQKIAPHELESIVRQAIHLANPQADPQIAHDVISTAKCFGIDPVIFTALIWRESNFKSDSLSETGAVGLTQMTHAGIQEVLERTHLHGFRKLKPARFHFARCAPEVYRMLPTQITSQSISNVKSQIALHPHVALVYGALLLKLNLARTVTLKGRVERYRRALERYNGDPRIKSIFARDVLALTKRLVPIPEFAANDSRFLRMSPGL